MKPFDLIIYGNLVLDDVVYDDGRTRMGQPGGAVIFVALGAALWGARVGIVSRVGEGYPAKILEALDARGVDVGGVRTVPGPSLRTWLLYEGRLRRVVHRLGGPTHADVSPTPTDVPEGWHARVHHLAPMPYEIQRALVTDLAARPDVLLSLDPNDILTPGNLDRWRDLVADLDVFLLSEDEMGLPGGLDRPRPVLRALAGGRLRWLLLKRGARGGLVYDVAADRFDEWPARSATVVDPTGAGDAFAGGLLASLARREPMSRALERAVVSASFALEGQAAEGLLAASPERAEARWRTWFREIHD